MTTNQAGMIDSKAAPILAEVMGRIDDNENPHSACMVNGAHW
jgi:hypothetical protein